MVLWCFPYSDVHYSDSHCTKNPAVGWRSTTFVVTVFSSRRVFHSKNADQGQRKQSNLKQRFKLKRWYREQISTYRTVKKGFVTSTIFRYWGFLPDFWTVSSPEEIDLTMDGFWATTFSFLQQMFKRFKILNRLFYFITQDFSCFFVDKKYFGKFSE